MKKVVIIFALMVSAVSLTKAQGGGGGQMMTAEQRAEASVGMIPASVNLTADQKTKILAIYMAQTPAQDSMRTAMMALRQSGGDMAPVMAKRTELTAAADAKILAVLSDDQKKSYAEYVKSRPAGGMGRGGAAGGGQGGAPVGQRPPGN